MKYTAYGCTHLVPHFWYNLVVPCTGVNSKLTGLKYANFVPKKK